MRQGDTQDDRLRRTDTAKGSGYHAMGVGRHQGSERDVCQSVAAGPIRQRERPHRPAEAQALIAIREHSLRVLR